MHVHRLVKTVLSCLVLASATACSTAPPSIFQPFTLDRGSSVATDAGQRVIVNMKTHASSRPGRVNPERIICAEPSPDVATAVASSFGFGLNILGKANTALSTAQGTALAQLAERTITVQLLRDQMYQACQAYANGAISGTEYSLLMSRNNDAMVTLMLGESAARLAGRKLATASVDGKSEATANMPDLIKAMTEAQQESDQANKDATAATENSGNANAAVQATNDTTSEEGKKTAEKTADDADQKKDDAQKQADKKSEEAKKATEKLVSAITKASTNASSTAGGFPNGPPTLNEHAVGVAEQLVELQENYFGQGAAAHFISACTVELGNNTGRFKTVSPTASGLFKTTTLELRTPDSPDRPEKEIPRDKAMKLQKSEISNDQNLTKDVSEPADTKKNNFYFMPGDNYTDDGYAALAYDLAQEKEQNVGIFGKWGRKAITENRLRTMVALEERERASSLAVICSQMLSESLKANGASLERQAVLNFMIDLERERSKRYKSAKPSATGKSESKPNLQQIMPLVEEYILCDKKSEGVTNANRDAKNAEVEACRVRVLAKIADENYGGKKQGSSNGLTYEDSLDGPYIALIAIYDNKKKADENWPKVASALGKQLLADKKKSLKKVKSGGVDKLSLRLGSFADEASAKAFCAKAKPKLMSIGGDCIPAKK